MNEVPEIERVDPELNEEFHASVKVVNASADAVNHAMVQHHKAQAVCEYLGAKIREKYQLAPADQIAADGTITRVAKAPA